MKNHVLLALAAIIFIGSLTGTSYAQTAGDVAPTTAAACIDLTLDLQYGQTSANVTILQQFLVEEGLLLVAPTGYFGNATLSAVKAFQTQKGILSSGYVGPITRAAIKSASGCTGTSGSTTGSSAGSTAGSVTPAITLKVNGSEGPYTIAYDSNLTFTWSSNASVTNCRMGAPFTTRTFSPSSGTAGSLTSIPKSLTPATYQSLYGSAPSTANLQVDYTMSCSHNDPSVGLLTDTVRVISTTAANAPTTPTTNTNPAVTYTSSASTSARITSFTVTPTTFTEGQMVTASWTSTQTTGCSVQSAADGSFIRRSGVSSASKNFYPTERTTFKLTCTDSNNVQITSSEIVVSPAATGGSTAASPEEMANAIQPVIRYFEKSINLNPVIYPKTFQLMWDTNYVQDKCILKTAHTPSSGYLSGKEQVSSYTTKESNILNVTPLLGTTVYTLTCRNFVSTSSGYTPIEVSKSVSIEVITPIAPTPANETISASSVPATPNITASCRINANKSYDLTLSWTKVPGATNYPLRLLTQQGVPTVVGMPLSDIWNGATVPSAPTGTWYIFKNLTGGTHTYWGHSWSQNGWSGYEQKNVTCNPTTT